MNHLKNNVQLIGHLGADPEVKQFGNGKKMARCSLATSEQYINSEGEKVSDTQWHHLVAWGKTAETAEHHLGKGDRIAVSGKLINRSYENKDGEKRYITEIVVRDLLMLGNGKGKK